MHMIESIDMVARHQVFNLKEKDMKFEAVIGLEVHVQLDTNSKMFTRVPCGFGHPPNSLTDAVILGTRGTPSYE